MRLRHLLPWRRRATEDDVREELESLRAMAEPGELGNLTLAAEAARDEWTWPRLERIARDLGMALRTLRKNPGYSLACIAILAMGIGANTAIFSAVYAVVLKPLPFPEPDRLVFLWEKIASMPDPIGPRLGVPRIVYQEWQKQTELFDAIAAFGDGTLNEVGVERPRTLSTAYASTDLFRLLGVPAAAGRLFAAEEEQTGKDRVVILSDAYFDRRFQRDPGAIGKSITLGRYDYTVIGVLPARFLLPAIYGGMEQKKPEVWVPLSRKFNVPADDKAFELFVMARRKADVSVDRIRTALGTLQKSLNKSDSERYPVEEVSVFPAQTESRSEDLSFALYILLGAVGLLLLIGCANLANLTLSRAARRMRETSIRRALGASRGRIISQLLTESLLLSLAGAGCGLLLASLMMDGLLRAHVQVPDGDGLRLNWAVLAFTFGVSLLTTVLFGLAPAILTSNVSVNEALKSRGGGGASAVAARGRSLLTVAEVGLAVVLLCGAGLMIRTFVKLVQTGLGFRTEHLEVARLNLPETRYPDDASRARFYAAAQTRARAIPGVTAATVSTTLPLASVMFQSFSIVGRPAPKSADDAPKADNARVTLDYRQVIGLPLLTGRDLTQADITRNRATKGDGVILVNRALAEKFFSGENALQQRLRLENDRPFEIVGVVENFLALGALEDARPQFFAAGVTAPQALLVMRTAVPPETISDEVRSALLAIDPELPIVDLGSMDDIINEVKSDPQIAVVLLAVFAGLALLLAMIGVYSVLTNLVTAQTRELGIRMALGATASAVGWMVVRQCLKPLVIGLALGLAGSVAVSRVLASFLGRLMPQDPLTFVLAVIAVLVAAPLALWGPVRRATRVECTVALREE
jgi:predicted permease